MRKFRESVAEVAASGLDARLVQMLTAAWQRLLQSGVLQSRGIIDHLQRTVESAPLDGFSLEQFVASVDAAAVSPSRRTCALPGCGTREAHPAHFKSCSACRTVVYCSKEHQTADWPCHKAACKAARKAAAATDGGAAPSTA
jgi:hypothetical protein